MRHIFLTRSALISIVWLASLFTNPAMAQSRFEDLVRGPFASPFETSVDAAAAQNDLDHVKPRIESAINLLVQEEMALESSRRLISEHGFTATSFFLEVRNLAAAGEFEKLTALVTGGKQTTAAFS